MGGADPKYLDLQKEETIKYNIRIEDSLINKYKELSNLTGKSTARIIKEVLREYLQDRNVYNNYLENTIIFYLKIPYNTVLKNLLTSGLEDAYFFRHNGKQEDYMPFINMIINNEIDGITNYRKELETLYDMGMYKVYMVPNNLDQWNKKTQTYSSYYKYGTDNINTGLELLIIPGIAEHTQEFLDCLYCFYFELNNENNNLMVTLISIDEALDLIIEANNNYLENLANTIYNKLKNAETKEEILEIAKTYNTNNIINTEPKPDEDVQPLKVITEDSNIRINYNDKTLLNKVEALEKENEELKNRIDTIEEDMLNKVLKVLDQYK